MDCHGAAMLSGQLQNNIAPGVQGMREQEQHMMDALPQQMLPMPQQQQEWAAEYAANPLMHQPPSMAAADEMMRQFEAMTMAEEYAAQQAHHQQAEAQPATAQGDWALQFQGEDWAADFTSEEVQVFGVEGEAMVPYEQKVKESAFFNFLNQVKSGDIVIEENGQPQGMTHSTEAWASEFAQPPATENWAEQAKEEGALEDRGHTESDDEYRAAWEDAQANTQQPEDEWTKEMMMGGEEEEGGAAWTREYEELSQNLNKAQENAADYAFDPNNPYLFHDNPFQEGMELRSAGCISEAVLAFEASCQKEPSRVEAWQFLGTTQAENEKDSMAIRALMQARKLDPANLAVHSALAVSHTNESNQSLALQSLRDWVLAHPRYAALGESLKSAAPQPQDAHLDDENWTGEMLFVSPSELRDVATLYHAAIELDSTDADLHVNLGILHNLSHEYDLAADDFRNALKLRPNDDKLWNKLGATLANGNRSAEALEAYNKALDINPGFVRAQYNLGISYGNMGDQNMAARQFLRAIVMQQGGVVQTDPPSKRSTRELWDILRMTFNMMERPDLVDLTWKQDVSPFLPEFGLSDLI